MILSPTNMLAAIALIAAAAPVHADWLQVHKDSTHNGVQSIATVVSDISGTPTWSTSDSDLESGARAIIHGNVVYTVVADDGGTSGFGQTSDDNIYVRAYSTLDGSQLWESPALDVGDSVGNGSVSTVAVDAGDGAVYFASGASMHRLNPVDGTITWGTVIDATSTAASRAYGIVNSSPSLTPTLVTVATTDFGMNPSQVVAFDKSTGAVAWSAETGGTGATSPLFIDAGVTDIVVADTGSGLVALNALTGAEVWNHTTVTTPWAFTGGPYGGVYAGQVFDGTSIYAVSYDFSADGQLAKVDYETGEADFVSASVGTDVAPVVLGTSVYLLGGAFGDADLVEYSTVDGSATNSTSTSVGFFRNYLAATTDSLYVTLGGALEIRSYAGAVTSTSGVSASGPVTVDDDGTVYTYSGGSLVKFDSTSSVTDWLMF